MFRDEFIGDLLLALPHPDLNYDRWVMELDPGERNRRYHFGEPEEATRLQEWCHHRSLTAFRILHPSQILPCRKH